MLAVVRSVHDGDALPRVRHHPEAVEGGALADRQWHGLVGVLVSRDQVVQAPQPQHDERRRDDVQQRRHDALLDEPQVVHEERQELPGPGALRSAAAALRRERPVAGALVRRAVAGRHQRGVHGERQVGPGSLEVRL